MDLISRQNVIDLICETSCGHEKMNCIGNKCKIVKAIEKMPSAEPERHESSRNALYIRKTDALKICMEQIESLINTYFEKGIAEIIKKKITELPSAEPEITRCKDCKHYCTALTVNGTVVWCKKGYARIADISDDWFCADAERKNE